MGCCSSKAIARRLRRALSASATMPKGDVDYDLSGTTSFGQRFSVSISRNKLAPSTFNVHLVIIDSNLRGTCRSIKMNRSKMSLKCARMTGERITRALRAIPLDLDYRFHGVDDVTISLRREDITLVRLPSEALARPDDFLDPGDEIYVQCKTLSVGFFHSGLYAGHNRAYHFTSNSLENIASISEALCHPGSVSYDKWSDFVYSMLPYEPASGIIPVIYKVSYPLQIRSGDQILKIAEYLRSCNRSFTYDVRRNNCQHFSSYCSVGRSFSYDMSYNYKHLACSVLLIGNARKLTDESFFESWAT